MDKKITDYLPFYLGCEYVLKIDSGKGFTKPAILNSTALGAAIHKHQKPIHPILILRVLRDMTEEEFYYWNTLDTSFTGTTECMQLEASKTIYLLSKHFDLFGLIESGLAIDKTTLNQTT